MFGLKYVFLMTILSGSLIGQYASKLNSGLEKSSHHGMIYFNIF